MKFPNSESQKKVLIISHTFPPIIKTGTLRVVGFANHLPSYGWTASVLTVDRKIKNTGNNQSLNDVSDVSSVDQVYRVAALYGGNNSGLKKNFTQFFEYPDAFAGWVLPAINRGYQILRNKQVDAIFSTFPVASAHLIAACLHRLTKVPWIADFRDPMVQDGYPPSSIKRKIWSRIERSTVNNARTIIFTTESACRYYQERYSFLDSNRSVIIPNGYIESDFQGIDIEAASISKRYKKIRFIHAGTVYAKERNPKHLFSALSDILKNKACTQDDFVIELYGAGDKDVIQPFIDMVNQLGLSQVVKFYPHVPHEEMLGIMTNSDILLVLQDSCCDYQIPAKVYEYFRLRKPIVALTTAEGDTGQLILKNEAGMVAPLDDTQAICSCLEGVINASKKGQSLPVIPEDRLAQFTREQQAGKLANHLNECLNEAS